MARRKEQKNETGRGISGLFLFSIDMIKDKSVTLKEIVYSENGKSLTEVIKESFLNYYFLRRRQN